MAKGKAAVLMGVKGRFEIMEFEVPEPEPGAIVVKTEASGLCGSDVHIWDGELVRHLPNIIGHEVVGSIVALGAGMEVDAAGDRVAVGDKVQVVMEGFGCGHCYHCSGAATEGV